MLSTLASPLSRLRPCWTCSSRATTTAPTGRSANPEEAAPHSSLHRCLGEGYTAVTFQRVLDVGELALAPGPEARGLGAHHRRVLHVVVAQDDVVHLQELR